MVRQRVVDRDIRAPFILRNIDFFQRENCAFVNEYGINSTNICDLAFFDFNKNIFYGFEIKSEKDNLNRLYKQLTSYTTYFNIVYVVCYKKHTAEVTEMLESYNHLHKVGIIEVRGDVGKLEFEEVRRAKLYKPFYDLFMMNLDLDEIKLICENHNIPTGKNNKKALVSSMKLRVSLEEVYEGMHNKLRKLFIRYCPICGSYLYKNVHENGQIIHQCYCCNNKYPEENPELFTFSAKEGERFNKDSNNYDDHSNR